MNVTKKKIEEKDTKIISIVLIISILIISGLLIFSNWKIAQKRRELSKQIESLRKEIEELEKKNQQLQNGIGETEKQGFWEAKVREQGYQKPGEEAVVIKKEEKPAEEKPAPKNIWEKFLAEISGILK